MNKQLDVRELGEQMHCSNGVPAKEIENYIFQAGNMMIFKTVDSLELITNVKVLEIGFGNAKHLPFLFQKASGICYYGIDTSEAFVKKAFSNNTLKAKEGRARFIKVEGDGILNFQNDFFDCCFSANALYFWKNPIPYFMEIHRVMRPGGKFAIAFIEKKFAGRLPWTQLDFTLYEVNEIKKIFQNTGFINIEVKQMTAQITGKGEQEITEPFVIMIGQKEG
ncbi:Ubiquinone/menaquinone biosynthesis C-methylase UbiE [Mucilaginibacter lappiensis]|uniref:SAM-dependent methyltransferase n=1 Tax=Mucilaginibacter lappiensis TaxID=354630 RepID=A0ABR6PPQ3_9SPHI|nr:class I SAM-dependent methyltransferase [Mucilaginibacter lappiensis]MBB6110266.1 SAM-dependent methyltransferase [Mucilaginibacter lappiensis]SIR28428.1 Ubiquinone/menaquinone biosynthesis C-methylase UbiE [Mucilaginibacter lappiensis]